MHNPPAIKPKRRPRHSIQWQLALSFGSVALLMLLALTGLLLSHQRDFLNDSSIRRANALANGLAHSSSSWVLANDVAGLGEVLQGYIDTPNLDHALILSRRGEVLASTHAGEVGLYVNDALSQNLLQHAAEAQVLVADNVIIDVAAPIVVDNRHIGWVRIVLNQQETQANLQAVLTTSVKFMLITVLIVLVVSTWLAKTMGKRLQQVISVAIKITNGERQVRAELDRNDEIGHLAESVNRMLDTITRSEANLDRLNHVYAAWTDSVATIVREADEQTLLNRICAILAEKINFRLVFVGVVDADNDWIKFVASSNWDLPYLNGLKVSVDPLRPEGQGPLGCAIREQATQILNDFQSDPRSEPWHEAARANSIRSVAAFPLSRNKKVMGGIAVYSEELDYFTADIITLLNGLAADVSFALDAIDRERERRQAEVELSLAASVFENSQEGILITDAEENIIRVNSTFSSLTGYQAEEVIGRTPHLLASGQHDENFYRAMWAQINGQGYWQGEIINRRKDGCVYPEWLSITRVTDSSGQLTHYVGAFIDITDRKLDEERIHKLAFYDPLTQLPNRRLLIERLRQAVVATQRSQLYGALMFMDLDRFKILNDTQGHDLGDQLLVEVARRIGKCVREQDTVARLGGDEFVIMLEELAEDNATATIIAQRVSDKILTALSQPYLLGHFDQQGYSMPVEHHSSASIGLTLFKGTQTSSEDLLKQADVAMYQAKQAGRNTLCVFDPDMQSSLNQRAALESDMRQAMQANQFFLHYQVQVNQQGRAIGAEVLLRWDHPLRGRISPVEFISLAEESGLIVALGQWVLFESCKTLAGWRHYRETEHLTLAVNVSAKQFNQADFVEQVKTVLDKTGVNPQRLKLEITESLILENVDHTIDTMCSLRELGIGFSMDDFGTGYSSLSYLQRLPLSQLKIDQSFVHDLANDKNDAAIIRAILTLGSTLGIDIVAEGVETEEQYAYLLDNGCALFQGYLFGKPEPLSKFEQRFAPMQYDG